MSAYAKNILDYVAEQLAACNCALDAGEEDGRINSIINEKDVISEIEEIVGDIDGVEFVSAPARHWYDFALETENETIPVNLKISTLRAADNISSKSGMFYALTGKLPEDVGLHETGGWVRLAELLSEHMSPNNRDYYCLIVNKNDTRDVFALGLKEIEELTPNGSNPPFQCNWGANRNPVKRTPEESNAYILDVFKESWRRRVAPAEAILAL